MSNMDKVNQIKEEITQNGNLYKRKDVLKVAEKVGLEYRETCNNFLRRDMMSGTRGVYDITKYTALVAKVKKTKTVKAKGKNVADAVTKKIAEPTISLDNEASADAELTDVIDIDVDGQFSDESELIEDLAD
jgi:hypothetical protein